MERWASKQSETHRNTSKTHLYIERPDLDIRHENRTDRKLGVSGTVVGGRGMDLRVMADAGKNSDYGGGWGQVALRGRLRRLRNGFYDVP